jgi:SNF2 family DNA or RNA helicase
MLNNSIDITYDAKGRRLVMKCAFHLADVMRGYPSKRFDPKSKTWRMPLVKTNILHFHETSHLYSYQPDDAAINAIQSFEALTAKPKYEPFPRHVYDFTRSASGYLPMGHQDRMLDLAWGLQSCAWFAKMGTGKTFATIHLAFARYEAGLIDALMIICPSTLRKTWEKELKKYATGPYDFRIHDAKDKRHGQFCRPSTGGPLRILAVSAEGLGVSEGLYDSACGFMQGRVMVVADESSRFKNPEAKRTQRAIQLGAAATFRLILNGTPIALGIQDLWSQYEFLDPNIIGSGDYWAFKTRYIVMGGYENKQIVGVQHVDELMTAIVPYTCEVGKDVLNLPPKVPVQWDIQLTPEQRWLLRIIVKGADGDPNAPLIKVTNTLEKMLRCRQVIGGWLPRAEVKFVEVDGIDQEVWETKLEPLEKNPKLDYLMDRIEENFAGTKVIIWTEFTHEIEAIRDALATKFGGDSVECYYGKTKMEDRSRIEDRYCNDPRMRFFIGNPVAAGLGLTLISGENDLMAYYSGTNAYINRAQSEDRSHRIGQENTVTVVDLIAEGSYDEVIKASIDAKMDVEEYVMTKIAEGKSLDEMLLGGLDATA